MTYFLLHTISSHPSRLIDNNRIMSLVGRWKGLILVGILSLVLYKILCSPYPPSPLVLTKSGWVQGNVVVSRGGRSFFEYLGIPYALPPTGALRYEPPLPFNQSWNGVRSATQFGSMCMQIDPLLLRVEGDEDCLFINVFTPGLNSSYPVLVFIYGGMFTFGHATTYSADYILDQPVVLVTFNYRVNSFGFLNTGDSLISGNMGLKDQNLALIWVQDNIATFGGDPRRVTLFGESAGGASVHLHVLSPMSKGFFSRAIAASGLATMPWTFYPRPEAQAARFAGRVGCPTHPNKKIVDCLKGKPAQELVASHLEIYDKLKPSIAVFLPTAEVEGERPFLSQSPRKLLASGQFNKDVQLLAGVNDGEGLIILSYLIANASVGNELCANFSATLPLILPGLDELAPSPTALLNIQTFYNLSDCSGTMTHKNLKDFGTLLGDWWWFQGFVDGIAPHVAHSNKATLLYYNTWPTKFSFFKVFSAVTRSTHPVLEVGWQLLVDFVRESLFDMGAEAEQRLACHGDEMPLLFPIKHLVNIRKGHGDYEFSKELIHLFTQFAEGKGQNLEFFGKLWSTPGSQTSGPRYMRLSDRDKSGMIGDPFSERSKFWKSLKLL